MTLRKFVSERGKIRARRVTGNCVQHQRDVAVRGQERPRDGPAAVQRAMKIILQKPVDNAREPRGRRRGRRRLRAQLPDPPGSCDQGREGGRSSTPSRSSARTPRASRSRRASTRRIASKLIAAGPLRIAARAGEEGKLFGSVTAADIAEAVARRPASRSTARTSTWTSRSVRSAPTRYGSGSSTRSSPSSRWRSTPRPEALGSRAAPGSGRLRRPAPFVSEAVSTLVPMAFHMGKTQVRAGVTRNLARPPAAQQSTAVVHCRPRDRRA